jgi:hypothetical protein
MAPLVSATVNFIGDFKIIEGSKKRQNQLLRFFCMLDSCVRVSQSDRMVNKAMSIKWGG